MSQTSEAVTDRTSRTEMRNMTPVVSCEMNDYLNKNFRVSTKHGCLLSPNQRLSKTSKNSPKSMCNEKEIMIDYKQKYE